MSEFEVPMYERFLIPEGTYEAVISSMDHETSKFTGREQVVVRFTLTDSSFDGCENSVKISSYYTLTLHPKGNLYTKFVNPMLGKELDKSDYKNGKFDLSQFIGQDCIVEVEHYTKKDGDVVAIVKRIRPQKGGEE